MHDSSLNIMRDFVERYADPYSDHPKRVLDVGSYDVNGSYRHLFSSDKKYCYTGLDMEAGPNVNITLAHAYDWSVLYTDHYDIVISGQAFEHMEFFWLIMAEMARVLRVDGLLCLINPIGFKEHRYPVDCYRFLADGMIALARYVGLEILEAFTKHPDSVLIAKKPYVGAAQHPDFKEYICTPASR